MRTDSRPPRIGLIGADVPGELVLATGAIPVRLSAVDTTVPGHRAEELLGAVDPAAVALLAGLLAGQLAEGGELAGIVCSRDREASLRIYYVLRELATRDERLPPVHLLDLVHLPRASTLRYDVAQLERLADVLARWTGIAVRAEALVEATARRAAVREALGRLQGLRARGRVRGSEALELYAAAETLPPDRALALIEARISSAGPAEERPRLFLSGSAHDGPAVYRAIEARGWSVVAEDHDRGALALNVDLDPAMVADEGYLAIARAYRDRGPDSATASAAARAEWAAGLARASGARAGLSWVRRHDEAPLWDFPLLRERLGVPVMMLRDQGLEPDEDRLATALDSLAAATSGAAR
ncbi:MAG: 2-hydroxyacyl-CoA dehydratase family protein [Nocardioides sp.]|uniref:2-hydroxyacyl-CoA dehydratase family protein n=1 Tax=Nocardioides sp. TaxID=35761 RepID=UPI0039E5A161